MSQFVRKFVLLAVVVATVLVMAQGAVPAKAQKTVVTWFVGLGTGTNEQQIEAQNKVVADFNASQEAIELKIIIAPNNQAAPAQLGTLIASGNAPDVVGPVGFAGSNTFAGQWMDLTPLVEKAKYDLAQFPESLVNLYKEGDALVGIPFAVFPGLIYYNIDLFDEAGLEYPPAEFGAKYMLDGKEVDWNWDTVAEIAKRLTVDANGNDATSADFDASKTEQFGFLNQWGTIRSEFSLFGGADVVNAEGKVEIPAHWREQAKWLHKGIWEDKSIPTAAFEGSALLSSGNPFSSGKVAMARTMLWYTCCLADLKSKWDIAVMPSYNGEVYAPADADTFRLHKDSKNADAAFTVLQYLLGEGALPLLTAYGAYPARPDIQDELIKLKSDQYPSVKNWAIVPESLQYAVAPGHEAYYPNFAKGQNRFQDFRTLLYGETGKDIDVDAELDKLEADLQAIIEAEPDPMPTEAPPTAEATAAE